MTASPITRTEPTYNGGPTFVVGDPVNRLDMYACAESARFGVVASIVDEYTVTVDAAEYDARPRRVGSLEPACVAERNTFATAGAYGGGSI